MLSLITGLVFGLFLLHESHVLSSSIHDFFFITGVSRWKAISVSLLAFLCLYPCVYLQFRFQIRFCRLLRLMYLFPSYLSFRSTKELKDRRQSNHCVTPLIVDVCPAGFSGSGCSESALRPRRCSVLLAGTLFSTSRPKVLKIVPYIGVPALKPSSLTSYSTSFHHRCCSSMKSPSAGRPRPSHLPSLACPAYGNGFTRRDAKDLGEHRRDCDWQTM